MPVKSRALPNDRTDQATIKPAMRIDVDGATARAPENAFIGSAILRLQGVEKPLEIEMRLIRGIPELSLPANVAFSNDIRRIEHLKESSQAVEIVIIPALYKDEIEEAVSLAIRHCYK
jgi:hypothetical protein